MPNISRTPDIAVTLNPQNYTENLTYPIFIGEILGKKDKGALYSQRYAGYNATMQSLVFAPRAYYWEIRTLSPPLYILQKDPAHGTIKTNMRTYHLQDPAQYDLMLEDLCNVFLDELINLRPISYISGQCMRAKEYKDFISKPSGMGHPIENQCWHLFVPKYNCQGIHDTPPDYHQKVDAEDKNKDFQPMYGASHVPTIDEVVRGNKVMAVDQLKIRETAFPDVEHCHAFRDKSGNAKNLKDMDILQYVKNNVKDLSKQTVLSDISNLLSTISNAGFFTQGYINQMRAAEPEVDSTPGTVNPQDGNVWELKTYSHGIECINKQDTSLNMSMIFEEDDDYEDPEHILDDPIPPEELMIEEEEDVEQLTARIAALPRPSTAESQLSTPRGATPQVTIQGQFPDQSVLLRSNTVKLSSSASEALKIYLSRTPVPDTPAPNTWSPSRGLPTTRQQARMAQQYMAAETSSPGVVTRSRRRQPTPATSSTQTRPIISFGTRVVPTVPLGTRRATVTSTTGGIGSTVSTSRQRGSTTPRRGQTPVTPRWTSTAPVTSTVGGRGPTASTSRQRGSTTPTQRRRGQTPVTSHPTTATVTSTAAGRSTGSTPPT